MRAARRAVVEGVLRLVPVAIGLLVLGALLCACGEVIEPVGELGDSDADADGDSDADSDSDSDADGDSDSETTCEGCWADGACVPGTSDEACGAGGAECAGCVGYCQVGKGPGDDRFYTYHYPRVCVDGGCAADYDAIVRCDSGYCDEEGCL